MITLPNIAMKAAVKTDADTSVSTDAAAGTDALPHDFLTALGNQLLSLAKQQGKAAQSADLKTESDTDAQPGAPLNALIAALDNPAALSALFKPENIKAGTKSADDKDKSEAAPLSASDMQNVQALFAMLPTTPAATSAAVSPVSEAQGELAVQNDSARKSLTSLAQMLTGSDQASKEPGAESSPGVKTAALNAAAVSSTASQSSTAAVNSNSLSPAQTLDSSFQQVLSNLTRQDDQAAIKASASDNSLIASTPISSASSLAPPVMASSTTSTPSTPMLNAQLGSDEWQQALSQQIVMFSRNGQQNAELRLHPADLGAIQISLKLDNDQAQINLVSGHSHVRAALEAAIPQLRSALAESGIHLGESQVSSDSSAQGQNFQQQQEARRDGQHGRFSLAQDSDTDITPIAVPAALQARVNGNGAVDTFA
ncbi:MULTISPECIES: flagellar hook-length control protein FliK [Pantoea]|jgi:flagellar hook-length control protein FliK|uniref:Flagellar hook-length control protein FliK n=1 Tax=Pantoea brenneri TaxID=472694 RepID=A0A7Y6NAH3_9GAMM|nr:MULTISPECIES: flagellar hook-length control protein FliK [Pantoea]MBZ6396121.1 flagellar hook-length control protein FliK [Pantoea sp.]MBZ6439386.1 flagellar hook-length control protein FliK [Pantoea sp.]NUY40020.1 flagellar hook-length control protein FliK [Pantoea brenneri]NUY47896.1 flagellar hook-length control protein FliK [Pantoea brenneri]NUY58223.1 flagellar hook-length control protein FliK [Pantoea brenneri]